MHLYGHKNLHACIHIGLHVYIHNYIQACIHTFTCVTTVHISRERMESARLTRTIFGFPDPLIQLIAPRVSVKT